MPTNAGGFQIAYQGKDIGLQSFSKTMNKEMLSVLMPGKKVPRQLEPMNGEFPLIVSNDRLSDMVFRTGSSSVIIIDFESSFKLEKYISYADYGTRVLNNETNHKDEKWLKDNLQKIKIRFIVFYLCNVDKNEVLKKINWRCLQLKIEPYFLTDMDGEELSQEAFGKLKEGVMLNDEDAIRLSVYPGTFADKGQILAAIDKVIEAIACFHDEKVDLKDRSDFYDRLFFVLSHLATIYVNYITRKQQLRIQEVMRMGPLESYFYENDVRPLKDELKEAQEKVEQAQEEAKQAQEEAKQAQDSLEKLRKEDEAKRLVQEVELRKEYTQKPIAEVLQLVGVTKSRYYYARRIANAAAKAETA